MSNVILAPYFVHQEKNLRHISAQQYDTAHQLIDEGAYQLQFMPSSADDSFTVAARQEYPVLAEGVNVIERKMIEADAVSPTQRPYHKSGLVKETKNLVNRARRFKRNAEGSRRNMQVLGYTSPQPSPEPTSSTSSSTSDVDTTLSPRTSQCVRLVISYIAK